WLRRADFITAAVSQYEDAAYINWSKARAAFDAGEFNRSSSTELAVLDLAIAIGENRYRLSSMGAHNAGIITQAWATALSGSR
ncbi:MAG TPA: hypothetical protein VK663_08075, partial [Burkholderiales bacterium]|nr:hypothetical protein [Burkholderiales bacterium]